MKTWLTIQCILLTFELLRSNEKKKQKVNNGWVLCIFQYVKTFSSTYWKVTGLKITKTYLLQLSADFSSHFFWEFFFHCISIKFMKSFELTSCWAYILRREAKKFTCRRMFGRCVSATQAVRKVQSTEDCSMLTWWNVDLIKQQLKLTFTFICPLVSSHVYNERWLYHLRPSSCAMCHE